MLATLAKLKTERAEPAVCAEPTGDAGAAVARDVRAYALSVPSVASPNSLLLDALSLTSFAEVSRRARYHLPCWRS
jgi:hypothetical protein